MSNLLPVILAGGSGTRLWPMSRYHFPKQFLALNNNKSLLQNTILRLNGIDHLDPYLICNEQHRFLVAEQIRTVGIKNPNILLEPVGRNTAPAVALAALHAIKEGRDPILFVLASDHMINDIDNFKKIITASIPIAEKGHLVTFGITPTNPETGYGYIHKGSKLNQYNAFNITSFIEKPTLECATQYLSSGHYLWNSGMFMFKASSFLRELKIHRADILEIAALSLELAKNDLDFIRIDEDIFKQCPSESIDYAVMEKTSNAIVVPMDIGWSDIGSWSSLWDISEKNEHDNVQLGDVLVHNSKRCYIKGYERLIAAVGVNDLIIVDTKDALLVAHKEQVQNVKSIVSYLEDTGRSEIIHHREIYRPWGKYDHIAEGERYHVKKVVVEPGKKTAMQLHYHRSEHWIIVSGTAKVYRGSDVYIIAENESIYIPAGVEHCFENPGKIPLELIEVRTGLYLAEDDIVRVQASDDGY